MGESISQALQAKLGIDLTDFERGLNRAAGAAKRIGGRLAKSFGVMRKAARTVAIATLAIGAAVVGLGALAVREFVQWEAAMTGVAKTVDASKEVITALGMEFIRLSEMIPVAAVELANIGEIAGQLGIAVPNILKFTEVIAALAVSTNLSAEAAATGLARLANVMGTSQLQFGRLGSTIVDLGNNLATSEAEILSFATRMAGAGRAVGLTEANVLAIGGALSSVGIEAEAGGTAVQKVLFQINTAVLRGGEEMAAFAKVSGLSASEFAEAWREDAGEAFTAFVEGIGRAGERSALVLEELGIVNERSIRSFVSLGNAGDLLRRSMVLGSKAWIENTALTDEAARFYDRLGARLVELRNKISNTAASIGEGLTPVVDAGIRVMAGFLDKIRESGPAIEEMASKMAASLPGAIEGIVQGIGSIGNALLTAVDVIMSLPLTAGFGLVGLVFLGPAGMAALGAIGFVIDAIIEKLGGAQTVAAHLQDQLSDARREQADLLRLRAAVDPRLGEFREGLLDKAKALTVVITDLQRQIGNLGPSDFAAVNDGFGAWRQSLGGVFDMLTQFQIQLGGVGGGGGGVIGGESPVESQSKLNTEVQNTIHIFENLIPLVKPVPLWIQDAADAAEDWGDKMDRLADTIQNQLSNGLVDVLLDLKNMGSTIEWLGEIIFRELVMNLIAAQKAGQSLSGVFDALGLPGQLLAGFGFISQFFADGGIVRGHGEVPVMAHAGEVVLSKNTVSRMGGPDAANQLNQPRFGSQFFAPSGPTAPQLAGAGAGGAQSVEVVLSVADMPEPADFGIIGSKAAAGRLFSAFVKNHRQNGGQF